VLPCLRHLAKLRYAFKSCVKVEDVLAIESLAGFNELKIMLGELSKLNNSVLAIATQLYFPNSQIMYSYSFRWGSTNMAKLLAIVIADFCVRGPQLGFNAAICGVLKVAEDDLLTRNAVPRNRCEQSSALSML